MNWILFSLAHGEVLINLTHFYRNQYNTFRQGLGALLEYLTDLQHDLRGLESENGVVLVDTTRKQYRSVSKKREVFDSLTLREDSTIYRFVNACERGTRKVFR